MAIERISFRRPMQLPEPDGPTPVVDVVGFIARAVHLKQADIRPLQPGTTTRVCALMEDDGKRTIYADVTPLDEAHLWQVRDVMFGGGVETLVTLPREAAEVIVSSVETDDPDIHAPVRTIEVVVFDSETSIFGNIPK